MLSSFENEDDRCWNCGTPLPDTDPDPLNTGDDPWWDGYCSTPCKEGIPVPSDEQQLEALDAYGHCNHTVGGGPECEAWTAHLDFKVWAHPSRGVLVAYHVVVDCERTHNTYRPEEGVVGAHDAPLSLASRWLDVALEHGVILTDEEYEENTRAVERWRESLAAAIEAGEKELVHRKTHMP